MKKIKERTKTSAATWVATTELQQIEFKRNQVPKTVVAAFLYTISGVRSKKKTKARVQMKNIKQEN